MMSKPKIRYFCIRQKNAGFLVRDILLIYGWKECTAPHNINLYWSETAAVVNKSLFTDESVIVNHIPNSEHLENKYQMMKNLKAMFKDDEVQFLPETYVLDNAIERKIFLDSYSNDNAWIVKPMDLFQGMGIHLVRNITDVPKSTECSRLLIQKYISNPLLINKKKFDIRCYMMIACTKPYLVLFRHGYVRICLKKYDKNTKDLLVHLTNQSVQKKDPNYESLKEETLMNMANFNKYINENFAAFNRIEYDWVLNRLTQTMKKILCKCFAAAKPYLVTGVGNFEIFGYDFLIDEEFKVWLLEGNMNPSMTTHTEFFKRMMPELMKEILDIVMESHEKALIRKNMLPMTTIKRFEILYCGPTIPFNMIKKVNLPSKNISTTNQRSKQIFTRTLSLKPQREIVKKPEPFLNKFNKPSVYLQQLQKTKTEIKS